MWIVQSMTLTNYIGIVRYSVIFSLSLFYRSKGVLCGIVAVEPNSEEVRDQRSLLYNSLSNVDVFDQE